MSAGRKAFACEFLLLAVVFFSSFFLPVFRTALFCVFCSRLVLVDWLMKNEKHSLWFVEIPIPVINASCFFWENHAAAERREGVLLVARIEQTNSSFHDLDLSG